MRGKEEKAKEERREWCRRDGRETGHGGRKKEKGVKKKLRDKESKGLGDNG